MKLIVSPIQPSNVGGALFAFIHMFDEILIFSLVSRLTEQGPKQLSGCCFSDREAFEIAQDFDGSSVRTLQLRFLDSVESPVMIPWVAFEGTMRPKKWKVTDRTICSGRDWTRSSI